MATSREIELAISAYIAAYDCEIGPAMEAALDAVDRARLDATSVRAEAGTAGMEIVQLVAKITLWRDYWPDSESDVISMSGVAATGLTPAHVRQARAIVAAAERKDK